jgi:hypothetical protein
MERKSTPEISSLIKKIKLRVLDGRPLNISAVKSESAELLEQAFLIRPFLGWAEAVKLSGVSYSVYPHEHVEFLKCPICFKEFKNLANHMRLAHESSAEELGCEKVAEEAVIARIGDLRERDTSTQRHWEAAWSREYVIDYFVKFYSQRNPPKRSDSFQNSVIRYCGGTEELCSEIGLYDANVRGVIFRSKEAVIAGIRERHRRGFPLNRVAIEKSEVRQCGLCENAVRIFGDWPTAVRAAGIDFDSRIPRKWTVESVRQAFRDILLKEGEGLRYGQLQKIDPGLVEAVRFYLGPYLQAKASVLGGT